MKLNRLLSLGLMTAGAAAALLPLQRRLGWDDANRTFAIALDFDDAAEAAVRAGLPLSDLLHQLWHAGATHLTLPEDTLARLLAQGRLVLSVPSVPLPEPPRLGRWNYLATNEPALLQRLQTELNARLPAIDTVLADEGDRFVLALGGDLASLLQVGLGFDPEAAHLASHAGLQPLPRPVSYAWPTAETIDRSLAQAAALAHSDSQTPRLVAFAGDGAPGHPGELILGHEMLMQETIAALQRHGLTFAYFAESRRQRGDWFVAKSLAPDVTLAHEFTQPQLVTEDMYSAAHRWGLLARERGIRLAVLRFFKVVHATTPLDCVGYVAALADVLVNREGMRLSGRPEFRPAPSHHHHDHGHHHHHHHHHEAHHHEAHHHQAPAAAGTPPAASRPALARDDNVLPWIALIPAGAGALALSEFLELPQKLAAPLTLAGLLALPVAQRLDRPANHLEATFRPSYAPKLIALGITASAPLAAALVGRRGGLAGFLQGELVSGLAAAGLAAVVADRDYALRIEEVKTWHLDWIAPLAGSLAVALTPALVARRTVHPAELVAAAPQEAVAALPQPPPRLALATPTLQRGRALALRTAWRLADRTLTVGVRSGETLLRTRVSGPGAALAIWAFNRGAGLARRRLILPAIQRSETSAAVRQAPPAAPPAPLLVVRDAPPELSTGPNARLVRVGILAAAVGGGLLLARTGLLPADPLALLDQEHSAEHTHHLSRAQATLGDARMALSPQPLRQWTLPAVAALAVSALAPGRAADIAFVAATLGGTAFLAGFRQAARPLVRTALDRVTPSGVWRTD